MTPSQKIEHVLLTFRIPSKVIHTFEGYSSNTYLLEVSPGVQVSSVKKFRLDIANGLDVENVRLSENLVKYGEKSYLSIEVPKRRDKNLIYNPEARQGMKFPLGEDNYGRTIYWNTESPTTPYMLACGAAGSGKSVFLFSIIESAQEAGYDNIIILDPKYEFGHLAGNGNIDVLSDIHEIEIAMRRCVEHMNDLIRRGRKEKTMIIFDEFADAVANARKKKDLEDGEKTLEENFRLLLQKGRSSGFRVVAATQRASVKVITGDAKANFSILVCFRVPKEADSRVVMDEAGAESLQGMGDGLIKSPDYQDTVRFQAYYLPSKVPA